jgi:hypothetical protein
MKSVLWQTKTEGTSLQPTLFPKRPSLLQDALLLDPSPYTG